MKVQARLVRGFCPDVVWSGATPLVVFQQGHNVCLAQNALETVVVEGVSDNSFPRIGMVAGEAVIAYRGTDSRPFLFTKNGAQKLSESTAQGNDPLSIDSARVVWQEHVGQPLRSRNHSTGRVSTLMPLARASGIAWSTPDAVFMRDQVRLQYRGGTQPTISRNILAMEHPDGGVIVRDLATGRETHLFPGLLTYAPRIAVLGTSIAVVTWGSDNHESWVRLATLDVSELEPPDEPPTPPPPPPPSEPPSVPEIPNNLATVKKWRVYYDKLGPGYKRAGEICNAVAWDLNGGKADGDWGLLKKTSGDNYEGKASDIVMRRTGESFDILGDGEGDADPQWSRTKPTGFADTSKFVKPRKPLDLSPTPPVDPPPPVEPPSEHPLVAELNEIIRRLEDLRDELAA